MIPKRTYYSDKIAECGNSKKCLFRITKNLMGHKDKSLCQDVHLSFSEFFMRKFTTIRDDIDNHKSPISDAVVMSADIKFEGQPLTKLAPATQDEVGDIIIKSPSKSRPITYIPVKRTAGIPTAFDYGYYKQITGGVQGSAFFQKGQY